MTTAGARGRFAPSPTGRLHLGNLRTALVAWLFARHHDGRFLLRFEDLDAASVRAEHYDTQQEDLAALQLTWDEPPVRQSNRLDTYRDAIADLDRQGRLYTCYCSRKDIREATQAPNGLYRTRNYPGTCRTLTTSERAAREASGRPPALRFLANAEERSFTDLIAGEYASPIDDFVIRRGDGTPAYNLAATIDDAAQGIGIVVRADDLLDSTPRQLALLDALGLATPRYAHIPLVLNGTGDRLAKRDGAVTLTDRLAMGQTPLQVRSILAASLGLCDANEQPTLDTLINRFEPTTLPTEPWSIAEHQIEATDLGLS